MKACVNYVGNSSMIVGIRVESENIQTGKVKHTNSSYFTMVAKDVDGKNIKVPGLILSNDIEIRRFYNCVKQIELKKDRKGIAIRFPKKYMAVVIEIANENQKSKP